MSEKINSVLDIVEAVPSEKECRERIYEALDLCIQYSQIDGEHHKAWTLDQIARALAGENYDRFVAMHNEGEDGPDSYKWNCGCPP